MQDVIRVLATGDSISGLMLKNTTIHGAVEQFPMLEGPLDVEARPAEHDMDYRTHYERRTRRYDRPVYRSLYVLRRK